MEIGWFALHPRHEPGEAVIFHQGVAIPADPRERRMVGVGMDGAVTDGVKRHHFPSAA